MQNRAPRHPAVANGSVVRDLRSHPEQCLDEVEARRSFRQHIYGPTYGLVPEGLYSIITEQNLISHEAASTEVLFTR